MNNNNTSAFYIYGKNPVAELLREKPQDISEIVLVDFAKENIKDKRDFADIIGAAKRAKIPTRYITKKEAILLVGEVRSQRVLAKVKGFKYVQFKDWKETVKGGEASRLVLVLDKIEDPQNFGAIVRSAGAAGVSAVFVANASQAPVTATVFKTSAGVVIKVPIVQVANISDTLEKLKDMGFWTYGVDMRLPSDNAIEQGEVQNKRKEYDTGSKAIWEESFDSKSVIVVGAEGDGLSRIAREKCDFLVHIPMQNNIESLNVSVAAALTMYEWRRQQS